MRGILVPPRRRGIEFLDEPGVDPALVRRSLADVARANLLFGGAYAVLRELDDVLRATPGSNGTQGVPLPPANAAGTPTAAPVRALTLLDVGTGAGDIPVRASRLARRRGIALTTVGLDESETLVAGSRRLLSAAVRGDALALPIATKSVDVVTCSQVLHHFPDAEAVRVIRELDRVARVRVIISDLRRSWFAAAGIWIASFPLGFHPVSRHDGVVSVMRGYTPDELCELVTAALQRAPTVRRRIGFRVTATWVPEKG